MAVASSYIPTETNVQFFPGTLVVLTPVLVPVNPEFAKITPSLLLVLMKIWSTSSGVVSSVSRLKRVIYVVSTVSYRIHALTVNCMLSANALNVILSLSERLKYCPRRYAG